MFWTDVRSSARHLARTPGFSLIVITTMALVIAANTTIISLLNATVLRRVDAPDPGGLVVISATDTRTSAPGSLYADTLRAFRERQRSFASLALYSNAFFRCEHGGAAFDATVEGVTPEYFTIVGAGLAAGRALTAADETATGTMPAVLGHRLWTRVFGGDTAAIGTVFRINNQPATVVGVLAPGFEGFMIDGGVDVFLPNAITRALLLDRPGAERGRFVIGRLAPQASVESARAEVLATWPAMAEVTARSLPPPEQAAMASVRIDVESGANGFSVMAREWGPSFRVVLGLTAILLGVAIVNLTGLMSSRMLARRQEIAMCLALGSGPLRMMRRLLVEGIMLAVLALAVALPVAWSLSAVLEAMLTLGRSSPLLKPMTPDGAVVMVAVVMALGLGIAVGLLPAWGAVKASEADVVRSGRGIVPSLGRSGRVVLVTQVALSMVLLVGAGLFVTMLANLHRHDAAFRGSDVVWTRLTRVPGTQRTPLTAEYYRTLVDQLQAIPGAKGAVLNFYFPAFLGFRGGFPVDRYTRVESPEATPVTGLTEIVTPGFFEFFGITRMRGRDFTWDDDGTRPGVAIASRSLAEGLFGGTDAIGRRVRVQAGSSVTDLEIVGVVEDAPIGSIREPRRAVLFRPLLQDLGRGQAALAHVRVNRLRGAREGYVRAVESQGQHYVRGFYTLEEWLDNALLQERLIAGVSAFAASMALLLAGLGVYGALAYAVVSRVREIGVRMALGASRQSVVRMIVRDGLAVVVPGVAAGIPIAVGAALLIRSQLYGVSPTDPATIAAAAGVFVVTGVAAAWLPARRAARIEPSEALRQE